MLQWLKDAWFGSAMVEFESTFDLTESIRRLRAATKRSVFSAMAHQEAVGTVREERVSLQRVIPMMGNSFKPFFVGRFSEDGGRVVLRGCFTMPVFAKLFMGGWFGILALGPIGLLIGGIRSPQVWLGLPFVIGMMGFGLAIVRLGQWFSRRDPAWLSAIISTALAAPTAPSPTAAAIAPPTGSAPVHLLALAGFIGLSGALQLAAGIIGLQLFQLGPRGASAAFFAPESMLRPLTVLLGMLLLAWAYGIYRRHLLAWWAGFGFFALSGIATIETQVMPQLGSPSALMVPPVAMIVPILLVLAIWEWWWYGQRAHFSDRLL